jgi:hypothetical protein
VTELDRFTHTALGDRAGIAVVQADPPGGTVWNDAGESLPGLGGDLAGRGQQVGQVVDRTHQPAAAATGGRIGLTAGGQCSGLGPGSAHRLLGVDQQPLGIATRGFGQLCELTGGLEHRGPRLVSTEGRT